MNSLSMRSLPPAAAGALSGMASILLFTVIHHIWISNIWFSAGPMLVSGALCGASVYWSYNRLVAMPSVSGWLVYNLLHVALFGALGAASVLMFDPQTTIAAVVAANEMPSDLIGEAMPLTVLFTLVAAAAPVFLFRARWQAYGTSLVTCVLLIVTLGLNVSIIGLVEIPGTSAYLVVELFVLIAVLSGGYAVLFTLLGRRALHRS